MKNNTYLCNYCGYCGSKEKMLKHLDEHLASGQDEMDSAEDQKYKLTK